jgi:Ribbon-helix-helix domain
MTQTARWSLKVSAQTDRELRMHLAANGGKKGDMSRYVEDVVKRDLLTAAIDELHALNADADPADVEAMIEEEMREVRKTFWAEHRR